jgi:hypothetical protein
MSHTVKSSSVKNTRVAEVSVSVPCSEDTGLQLRTAASIFFSWLHPNYLKPKIHVHNAGLLKMIVEVLTTCYTQYTWDKSIFIFHLIEQHSEFLHPLWFYKHQHDNRVRSKLSAACQRWWIQWRFAAILVNCAPSGEIHNYCTPHIIKENYDNFLIHRCNYIPPSQVCCVW